MAVIFSIKVDAANPVSISLPDTAKVTSVLEEFYDIVIVGSPDATSREKLEAILRWNVKYIRQAVFEKILRDAQEAARAQALLDTTIE